MNVQHILYINAQQLELWRWQNKAKRLIHVTSFNDSTDDKKAFASYLRAHYQSAFSVLLDDVSEDFQREKIHILRGKERRTVVERKLAQHFPDTPWRVAISCGIEDGAPRMETLLLAALYPHAATQSWLELLREHEVILAGVYSFALLSEKLAQNLCSKAADCLLVSIQGQTLRQSLLIAQRLQLSRVSLLSDTQGILLAQAITKESLSLLNYVRTQHWLPPSQTLAVYILAEQEDSARIQAELHALGEVSGLRFQIVSLHDCAKHIVPRQQVRCQNWRELCVHLLCYQPPRMQFADALQRRFWYAQKWQRALQYVSYGAFFVSVVWALALAYQSYTLHVESTQLAQENQHAQSAYQAIQLPELPSDAAVLRQIDLRYQQLAHMPQTLLPAYQILAEILDAHPEIVLSRLEWSLNAARQTLVVVHAHIKHAPSHKARTILTHFADFVRALESLSGWQLTVIQAPFETGSEKALKGLDLDANARAEHPFIVQLTSRTAKEAK